MNAFAVLEATSLTSSETVVSNYPPLQSMTIIRYESNSEIDDLLPCEYKDPWPPSDEEIEMLEWLEEQNELERSIPSIAEMNRGLK